VPDVVAAAGVGRLDLVRHLADVASKEQLERALIMAARYGRLEAVEYLLDRGVDIGASDGMTALHWAAGGGHLDTMKVLIARGAPLETKNEYGGTVLDSTLWFAWNARRTPVPAIDYPAAIEMLIAAGANADLYPEMRQYIDGVMRR
jgi:hypothetical protein